MILSDTRILEEIEKGTIKIEPYERACLGSNSYDVHLGKWLAKYKDEVIDARKHNLIDHFEIPDEGFVLQPFGRMGYISFQRHFLQEEGFRLIDMPDPKFCVLVDIMLIKKGHL